VLPTGTARQENLQYAPGEVIIKLKEKETRQILSAQSYSERKATNEDVLANLKRKYKLREEKPVFKQLHAQLNSYNMSLQQLQTQKKSRPFKAQNLKPKTSTDIDLIPIYIVKTDQNVIETSKRLNQDPDIEYAEPNYILKTQMHPDDPYYSLRGSWGQDFDDLWGLKSNRLNCEAAWDIAQGAGVIVAVIDTGVDYNHEDIVTNMWTDGDGYHGYDFVNDDNDPMDDHGHGTHCAGTIAAVGNNGIGIIGVAPMAKIMAVKGLDAQGSGYSSGLAECVIYAADNGADVLSNSWGGWGTSRVLTDAFHYAYNQGCVCIAAAGNDNADVSGFIPANIDTVMAISASTPNDEKCSFSNYGDLIDIAAPGQEILSLRAEGTDMYGDGDHIVDGDYYWSNGTSMACPHVAGTAALVLSRHPEFNSFEVQQALRITVDDLGSPGFDAHFGYGRLNAYNAVSLDTFPIMGYISNPGKDDFVHSYVNIIGSIYGTQLSGYELYYWHKDLPDQKTLLSSYFLGDQIVNDVIGSWDTSLIEDGDYLLGVKVIGLDSNSLWYKIEVKVDNINSPPVFNKFTKEPAYIGEEYTLVLTAIDEDDPEMPNGQFEYEAILIPAGATFDRDAATLEWIPTNNDIGYNTCIFRVSDGTYEDYMVTRIMVLSEEPEEAVLIDDYGPQAEQLYIWEDYIVFYNWDAGALYLCNISEHTVTQIGGSRSGDRYAMRDNKVVLGCQNGIDIYDIEHGTTNFVQTALQNINGLNVSSDKIVYSALIPGVGYDVYLYDISRQEEICVAPVRSSTGLRPKIWGDNVVWNHNGTYLHTISNGKERQLDGIGLGALYGNKILFAEDENMYCYNIITGLNEGLALKRIYTPGGMLSPRFQGDCFWNQRLVYEDPRYSQGWLINSSDVFVYDLIAETEIRITHTQPSPDYENYADVCLSPAIWGDKIVWHNNYQAPSEPSHRQIRLAVLPVFNNPPEFIQTGDKVIHEGEDLEFVINATDFENELVMYNALNLPRDAVFDPQTQTFSWNPDYNQQGDYKVYFTASDGNSLDLMGVNIRVLNDNNQPPELDPIGNKEIDEGEHLAFRIHASDPDDDSLVYSVSSLPEGANFNNQTHIFDWTPTFEQEGDYSVIFTVSDGEYEIAETILISVLNVNEPPAFDSIDPQQMEACFFSELAITARDPEGDSLTFIAPELPEGASFREWSHSDRHMGYLDWIPALSQIGPYDITFTVSDGEHEVSIEVHIDVVQPSIQPTVVRVLENGFRLEGVDVFPFYENDEPYPFESYWMDCGYCKTDSNGEEHFIISEGDRVKFVALHNQTEYWSDVVEAPGEIAIHIGIVNNPPVIEPIGNQEMYEAQVLTVPIVSYDPDGDMMQLSGENLPNFASLSGHPDGTAEIIFTPTIGEAGTYPDIIIIEEDIHGARTEESFTLTIYPANRPPDISAIPDTLTKNEGDTITAAEIELATDPDRDTLTYTYSDWLTFLPYTTTYDDQGTHTLHVDVSDGTDVAGKDIFITVNNVNRPPILDFIGDKEVNEGQLLEFTVTASDPDGDLLTHSMTIVPTGASYIDNGDGTATFSWIPNYDQAGTYIRVTFIVSDSELTDSTEITIIVHDVNRPPDISAIPDTLTKDEGDTITAAEIELATDPDGDALTYTYSGWFTSLPYTIGYEEQGEHILHVEVSDGTDSVGKDITITVNNVNEPPQMLYLRNLWNRYFIWLGRDKEDGYRLKYSYRVDEKEWSIPTRMRWISISQISRGLEPGNHVFQVKAIDSEGAESGIKRIEFEVEGNTPPEMLYLRNIRNYYLFWLGKDKEDGYNLKYSYRIDSGQWSYPSMRRWFLIRNLRLKRGEHLFEVKAIDKKGLESEIKSIEFIK